MPDPRLAAEIADEVLFPQAVEVDRSRAIPPSHLDLLAQRDFYGLEVATAEPSDRWLVNEILASGCLATAFVLIQHQGAVRAVLEAPPEFRSRWLEPLLRGNCRAGIGISAVRRPHPTLRATLDEGRWTVSGSIPWVTGWGMIDVFSMGAITDDGLELWALVDATEGPHLSIEPLELAAAHASNTVAVTIDGLTVPDDRILGLMPRVPHDPADGGGRSNGSMALGVARRACALMGPSPFDARLDEIRTALDTADDAGMAAARAAASDLAMQAAWRLVIDHGSRSILTHEHGQRLVREAAFTGVFGTRPTIRALLLETIDRRAIPS